MDEKRHSATMFVLDVMVIYVCFMAVFIHYRGWVAVPFQSTLLMVYAGLTWFVISYNSSISNVNVGSKIFDTLKDIVVGFSVLSAAVIAAVAIFGDFRHNDKLVLYPLLYALIIASTFRLVYLVVVKHFVKNGYRQRSVLVIGGGRAAEKAIRQILISPELGYRLYGFIADECRESLPRGYCLGRIERFAEIVQSRLVDEVIIALPLRMEKLIVDMVNQCEHEGIRVRIVPDFFTVVRNRAVLDKLGGIPLIGIRTEPLALLKNRLLKRAFDIVFALVVLVVLAPVFALLAIIIKASSSGPVFFKQKRVGANNVEFEIYKFRSMQVQDTKESDTVWTTAEDLRVTSIGKFMRRTNVDELPQFWNVLVGNMSVVGPRPEREHFVELFKEEIPQYRVRHLVKSGITGWAQVNGWRGDTSIRERVEHDIYYIENWSFWLDLKIIWLTVFAKSTYVNAY